MYGKVFESIYDGTLAGHWQAIVTMQQLIVLADSEGVVDMTPDAIARRTTIPLKIIKAGLEFLEKADPYTRTPGEDGKRIVLLDRHRPWGWRLVNFWKYRRLRNMKDKQEADRERIASKRNGINDVAIESQMSQSVANVAHAEAEADTETRTTKTSRKRRVCLPEGFTVSERVKVWAAEKGYAKPEAHLEHFVGWAKASGKVYADWDECFMNAIRQDWAKVRVNGGVSDQDVQRIVRELEEEERKRAAH